MTKSLKGGVHYIAENASTGVVNNDGGAVVDGGLASASNNVDTLRQGYDIGINIGSTIKQAASGRWTLSATGALAGGTFAYQPTREFIVMGYSTKVNGNQNTILAFGHSHYKRDAIHYNETDKSADIWNALRAGQWHILSGAFVIGGVITNPSGVDVTWSNDEAARVSRASPGEFAYMYGAPLPQQADYRAKTG